MHKSTGITLELTPQITITHMDNKTLLTTTAETTQSEKYMHDRDLRNQTS